jgi:hypothetical protein
LKEEKSPGNFLKYTNLGLQLLLVIGVSSWAGWKIDEYLGFKFPIFLLFLMLLSFGGMMYKLYRSLNE